MPRTKPERPCSHCGQPARPFEKNPHSPFCCARCKDADLARWLNGDYVIQTPVAWETPGAALLARHRAEAEDDETHEPS